MNELVEQVTEKGHVISRKVVEKFEIVKQIYHQQKYMYANKVKTVESRIVSLNKSHVRPIVRGKAGHDVEFGVKVSMSYVDGYLFVDRYSHENFN